MTAQIDRQDKQTCKISDFWWMHVCTYSYACANIRMYIGRYIHQQDKEVPLIRRGKVKVKGKGTRMCVDRCVCMYVCMYISREYTNTHGALLLHRAMACTYMYMVFYIHEKGCYPCSCIYTCDEQQIHTRTYIYIYIHIYITDEH
jgi:hypothetical protein